MGSRSYLYVLPCVSLRQYSCCLYAYFRLAPKLKQQEQRQHKRHTENCRMLGKKHFREEKQRRRNWWKRQKQSSVRRHCARRKRKNALDNWRSPGQESKCSAKKITAVFLLPLSVSHSLDLGQESPFDMRLLAVHNYELGKPRATSFRICYNLGLISTQWKSF